MPKDFRASMLERAIGRKIASWRNAHSLSLEEASRRVGFSAAKLSMMENAINPSSMLDIVALGLAYKVPVNVWQDVVRMADFATETRASERPSFSLFDPAQDFNESVFDADRICFYSGNELPVMFHSESYARAASANCPPLLTERYALTRMGLLALMSSKNPPRVEAIINASSFRREVGGALVMKAQLMELVDIAELPHITLQVLADEQGDKTAAIGTAFTWLRFPHRSHDDAVYVGSPLTGAYVEDLTLRTDYETVFSVLQREALSPTDSVELMSALSGDLADRAHD